MYVLVTQSCLTLCNPMDSSLPGSSVHGILQARILEWIAFPSPGDLPNPGIEPWSPALQAHYLLSEPPGKPRGTPQRYFEFGSKQSEYCNKLNYAEFLFSVYIKVVYTIVY